MRKRSVLAACASVASATSAALSKALDDVALHHMGRTRYPKGWSSSGRGFHPRLNRHNLQPHEHKREIARRRRQLIAAAA